MPISAWKLVAGLLQPEGRAESVGSLLSEAAVGDCATEVRLRADNSLEEIVLQERLETLAIGRARQAVVRCPVLERLDHGARGSWVRL